MFQGGLGMHTQRGFTVVELMVTLVVVFIVAGIGFSAYGGYAKTSKMQVIMAKVEQFRMFQDNFRIDNGRYVEGSYSGATGFVPVNPADNLGYVIADDKDGISFEVEAGACGNIANCYRVVATDGNVTGTWENNAWTWVE